MQVMDGRERALGGGSASMAVMTHLVQETELQKMLADEKMRSERHKTNYETLKAAHKGLQDEYGALQRELKSTIADCRLVQEKYTKLLEQARSELAAKIAENEQLRSQVVNPRMMESVKLQAQSELDKSYREQLSQVDRELDKSRSEHKKLKYDYNFLKSEFEHSRQEQQRIIEEMTLRNEAEVTNLRREREAMVSRQQQESSADTQHWRSVQRENVQLNLKVKGLLAELDEIRSQREHSGFQADNVTRLQVKQLTEHSATIKALETEKQSLRSQCDTLHREITSSNEENSRLTARVHELEKENIGLRSRTDEALHRSKLDVTNIRVEMLRERGEVERERDRLSGQLRDALDEIDVLKHAVTTLQSSVVEKEKESMRKVQAAREEEWQRMHKVESEKLDLESRIQELEKRRIDTESTCRQSTDKAEERVRAALDQKDTAEREALVCRTKLENQLQLLDSLERERAESAELRARLQRIEAQYNAYVGGEGELIELNGRLERDANELRHELERLRESVSRDREQSENVLAQNRASWLEEKCNLQSRIEDVDVQLATAAKKLSIVTNTYKQKKSRMRGLVAKLRDRNTNLQLAVEQLKIDKEALKRSIPTEVHEQLKKRLFDLVQRNREFRTLLLTGSVKQTQIGGMTFGTVAPNEAPDFSSSLGTFFDMNQKDLSQLRDRIDFLDTQQRQQLKEMRRTTTLTVGVKNDMVTNRDRSPPRSTAGSVKDESDGME